MKKIMTFGLVGILGVSFAGCTDWQNNLNEKNVYSTSSNNTPVQTNNNSVSDVIEFSLSNDNDIWEIGAVAKKLFDGGGTRSETDEYVLYTCDDRMISTKKQDNKEIIRYIGTTNNDDYIGRGISVGDSLEKLLDAFGNELTLETEWDNYHLASNKYDKVYKYSNDDESTQIIFSLKQDMIVMIQIAINQEPNNTTLML